jgi:hypothetical protein
LEKSGSSQPGTKRNAIKATTNRARNELIMILTGRWRMKGVGSAAGGREETGLAEVV